MKQNSIPKRSILLVLIAALVLIGCRLVTPAAESSDEIGAQVTLEPGVQEMPTQAAGVSTNTAPSDQPAVPAAPHLTLSGQLGGVSYAAAIRGNIAYVGAGPRLLALDMEALGAPRQIAQSDVLPGVIRDVLPHENVVYVAAGKAGVHVLKLTGDLELIEAGSLQTAGWAMSLATDGEVLIIATNANDILIADISDPAHPAQLGSAPFKRAASSVDVLNNTVYLGDASGGLTIVDISDPAKPVVGGTNQVSASVFDLTIAEDHLFLAAGQSGLLAFDLSEPQAPRQVGAAPTTYADGILVKGDIAYLSDYALGIYRFDVSDPANPSQTGHNEKTLVGQQVPGGRQMALHKETLLIPDLNIGLRLINVGKTWLEDIGVFETQLPGTAFDTQVLGDKAYVIEDMLGLFIADISDPLNPYQLGKDTSKVHGGLRTPRGIVVREPYAFIADINLGLRVIDISDASHPVEVAAVEKPKGMTDIALQGDFAYVTVKDHQHGQNRGVRVFDISNPRSPVQVGELILPHSPQTLAISGQYAVVPDLLEINEVGQPAALRIIDISDPTQPTQVGELDTTSLAPNAMAILASGNTVYLGDLHTGLHVIDLSNPNQPVLLKSMQELVGVYDLAINGATLFSASYDRVVVVDVADPSQPRLLENYITSGLAWGIEVVGEKVYVADLDGGLVILTYTP